jgi:hypothetical protein
VVNRSPIKRRIPLKRVPPRPAQVRQGFEASTLQRVKVGGLPCLVCGASPCDPAHLAARAQGGCDDPACVVPLCRACHRRFDIGVLSLLEHLEPRWRKEIAHCVTHLGLMAAQRRLTTARRDA